MKPLFMDIMYFYTFFRRSLAKFISILHLFCLRAKLYLEITLKNQKINDTLDLNKIVVILNLITSYCYCSEDTIIIIIFYFSLVIAFFFN